MAERKSIERLDFSEARPFAPAEAAVHLARYLLARPYAPGRRVLDAACGVGYGAYLLATRWQARAVHAVDIAEDAIAQAQARFAAKNVRYHRGDVTTLDQQFEPHSFDLIVSLETFEHLADPAAMLAGFRTLLAPGGIVLLTCPNDHWYYRNPEDGNPFHVRKYHLAEFRELSESVLGPARAYLLGTPLAGYVNLHHRAPVTDRASDGPAALFDYLNLDQALLAPTAESVTPENCAYFIGIWAPDDAALPDSAVAYPCSMDTSSPAHRAAEVEALRDDVVAARSRAFDLEQQVTDLQRSLRITREAQRHAEQHCDHAEREARHAGLRVAALRAENQFARERLDEKHRLEREHLERENEYKRQVIEQWGAYIKQVEADLAATRQRLESAPWFRFRRFVGRLLRRSASTPPASPSEPPHE